MSQYRLNLFIQHEHAKRLDRLSRQAERLEREAPTECLEAAGRRAQSRWRKRRRRKNGSANAGATVERVEQDDRQRYIMLRLRAANKTMSSSHALPVHYGSMRAGTSSSARSLGSS